ILEPDGLIDLESPLWESTPFTAFLLGRSEIDDVPLTAPLPSVTVLSATPITATEAAWVRLKGADAMRGRVAAGRRRRPRPVQVCSATELGSPRANVPYRSKNRQIF